MPCSFAGGSCGLNTALTFSLNSNARLAAWIPRTHTCALVRLGCKCTTTPQRALDDGSVAAHVLDVTSKQLHSECGVHEPHQHLGGATIWLFNTMHRKHNIKCTQTQQLDNPPTISSMRRSSHSPTSAIASRVLMQQEGDQFCEEALAMVQHVVDREQDALSQTRHLNNLLLQVRRVGRSPCLMQSCQGFGQLPVSNDTHPPEPSDTDSDLPPDDAVVSATDDSIPSHNDDDADTVSVGNGSPRPQTEQLYSLAQNAAARCIQLNWRRYLLRALRAQRIHRKSALEAAPVTYTPPVEPVPTQDCQQTQSTPLLSSLRQVPGYVEMQTPTITKLFD